MTNNQRSLASCLSLQRDRWAAMTNLVPAWLRSLSAGSPVLLSSVSLDVIVAKKWEVALCWWGWCVISTVYTHTYAQITTTDTCRWHTHFHCADSVTMSLAKQTGCPCWSLKVSWEYFCQAVVTIMEGASTSLHLLVSVSPFLYPLFFSTLFSIHLWLCVHVSFTCLSVSISASCSVTCHCWQPLERSRMHSFWKTAAGIHPPCFTYPRMCLLSSRCSITFHPHWMNLWQ